MLLAKISKFVQFLLSAAMRGNDFQEILRVFKYLWLCRLYLWQNTKWIITLFLTAAAPVASSQVTQVITPQQLVQQQHAHQQAIQENEQFALAWLRATYEPCGSGRVDHQELYKQYINSCAKIGRRGVIAPLHFPRCVR